MSLFFTRHDMEAKSKGLTFDDVLLVPQHSQIASRREPNLHTRLTKNFNLDIPIITANMDTITEGEMAKAVGSLGGLGILHRFMTVDQQVSEIRAIKSFFKEQGLNLPVSASIGVKEEGMERAKILSEEGVDILTIDIAHGDSIMMLETLAFVKKTFPHIDIIAGNVATPGAVKRLIENGADAVKVGIGPGSMCTTRIITGHGLPQLTAVALCSLEAEKHDIPVIADGGLKTSGDIVKAFAAGANTVMLGSMVSATLETPGELKGGKKLYRGMASKSAQVSWRGGVPQGMAAEGESTAVNCKGSVKDVILEITGGIRSGMSYVGVNELNEIKEKAQFIEMSSAGTQESGAHGVKS
jgi:IMP dehydrogenase